MPDLKELLRPLDDREMPDHWERIQRRPVEPTPEPRRSHIGAMLVAVLVGAITLGLIGLLLPLGSTSKVGSAGSEAPPSWLVDQAYRLAYENGDITPDSAEWLLSDANTIAPAVGLQSGDVSLKEYLVVFHGDFTAYGASVPSRASLPTGTILTVAFDANTRQVTDWGVGGQPVNIPGLQSFALPDSSQEFVSPQGWTAAVPPGWHTDLFTISTQDGSSSGATISNVGPTEPVADGGAFPQISAIGFAKNGVSLVVATMPGVIPGPFQPKVPPLSWDEFAQGSSGTGSSLSGLVFQGPDGVFTATVRVGDDASPIDLAAVKDVIASLSFGSSQSPSGAPTSSAPAALPSTGAVVDGRFVTSVQLDGGGLRVDPAPAAMRLPVPLSTVESEMLASPVFQGEGKSIIGFGLVTLTVPQHGIQPLTSVPAWIAFGWAGEYACPMMTAAPSPVDLPSPGYNAVVMGSSELRPFSYSSSTDVCGHLINTAVQPATHVESIPWHQVGPVSNGKVTITYMPPACGTHAIVSIGGDSHGSTLSVDMTVPDVSISCPSPAPVTETLNELHGVMQFGHAPIGYVKQI